MPQINLSNSRMYDSDDLVHMSNMELLEAVRDMESSYKEHSSLAVNDHRRHLDRKELENIFCLAHRLIELRRVRRVSVR